MKTEDFAELAAAAVEKPLGTGDRGDDWFVVEVRREGETAAGPFLVYKQARTTPEESMERFENDFKAACRALDLADPDSEWDASQPVAMLQRKGWLVIPILRLWLSVDKGAYEEPTEDAVSRMMRELCDGLIAEARRITEAAITRREARAKKYRETPAGTDTQEA